ncbi:hypothetical protein BAUCODRAFT_286901 [Baudoinia panamericana UAMH 10762]|uniref:Uncharacterized protein n=1 Tax=Baudoinia panamericana (strain UAMH 10762) TaxID=717646 RepID=M2LEE4_BAUPA|nr:uncharacterized protein BAUCODRAFT_286901 [Baudoinia panamericana UAMH 10762]EMC92372.1 hypothetical protein BAUCODRAFT_286901 [Baudoinia panamericana UAMH 10762]
MSSGAVIRNRVSCASSLTQRRKSLFAWCKGCAVRAEQQVATFRWMLLLRSASAASRAVRFSLSIKVR